MSLFESRTDSPVDRTRPLPERMRPRSVAEFVGQEHLLGAGRSLRRQIEADQIGSMVLWGPPGVGKTSLARVIAGMSRSEFVAFSGVLAGIRDVKRVLAGARRLRSTGTRTIVFVDEIHRFNKAQQDAFLPFVERGDIILIGATTENPSFEVISALLSRAKVYTLEPLTSTQLVALQKAALRDEDRGLAGSRVEVPDALLHRIAVHAGGDARVALLALETLATSADGKPVTEALVEDVLQRKLPRYDKAGEEHFNLISALHKSVRSSDPDAALYWLARMLEGGEDRLYIGRRLVRMAAEDVGLADPRAVEMAMAAVEAFRLVGEPEGDLFLAQVAVYLAVTPKSDSVYRALGAARSDVRTGSAPVVPLHLRNAPTRLTRELGYSAGYEHAHASEDAIVGMACLPDGKTATHSPHWGRCCHRPLPLSPADRTAGDASGPPLPARQPDPCGCRREREAVSHSQVDDGSGSLTVGHPGCAAPVAGGAGRPARAGVGSAGRAAAHRERRTTCITINARVGSCPCSTPGPASG